MKMYAPVLAAAVIALLSGAVPAAAATSEEMQFAQLLVSSPWCTFRYNKVSGTSRSTRYRFFHNGTYAVGSQGQTYSSGANGSVAGQSNSGNSGRWAVQNGMFLMSEGAGQMGQVPVAVKQNSNGYPVIVAAGIEYSQCR